MCICNITWQQLKNCLELRQDRRHVLILYMFTVSYLQDLKMKVGISFILTTVSIYMIISVHKSLFSELILFYKRLHFWMNSFSFYILHTQVPRLFMILYLYLNLRYNYNHGSSRWYLITKQKFETHCKYLRLKVDRSGEICAFKSYYMEQG